ncbi:MAG: 50S ribosomal protein L18 [Chloroflexi bacterium]|jgi:large subunit ribosomal protein L18|nr:50S ribosomal protein L18 [Chloroflexota bacterium]
MKKAKQVREARIRRHRSVRTRVTGTPERPRLNVFRSLHHTYAQIIDDSVGCTLISASTLEKEVAGLCDGCKKSEKARIVGKVLAERALAKGVTTVVFDRGGYRYHGRVKELAEGAREGGLEF